MASRDALLTPSLKYFRRALAHGTLHAIKKNYFFIFELFKTIDKSKTMDKSVCQMHTYILFLCMLFGMEQFI